MNGPGKAKRWPRFTRISTGRGRSALPGDVLEAGLDEADAAEAANSTMALIEGIHLHEANRDSAGRDQLVRWTIDRIVAGSSG